MNRKILVSLLFLLLLVTSVNALYWEWWVIGVDQVSNTPTPLTCGRGIDGSIFLRFHVPADTKVKFMIPRAYTMGVESEIYNRLYNVALLMNQPENKGTYTQCEEAIAKAEAGQNAPGGPYVCIEDARYEAVKDKVWVEGPTIEEESSDLISGMTSKNLPRGTCCARVPGMTWDGGQLFTGMWVAHSSIVIDGFRAWRGENHYTGGERLINIDATLEDQAELISEIQEQASNSIEDCSVYSNDTAKSDCEERNIQYQAVANSQVSSVEDFYRTLNNDLGTYNNQYPPLTLTKIEMKTNGREVTAEGDPYYIVIELNNDKKKCDDKGCVRSYWNDKGGIDVSGPPWESGIEAWGALTSNVGFSDPSLASGDSIDFEDWVSRTMGSSLDLGEFVFEWDHLWDRFQGLIDSIRGKKKKICVFGCHDVTVEVDFFTAGFGFSAQGRKEAVLKNTGGAITDYSERTDGIVCDLHSDYENVKDLGDFLEDGYNYRCESSGAYLRNDYRITCSSLSDTSCTVNTGTTGGQSHHSNPDQVYNDVDRTRKNFIEEFTNPNTGWLGGGAGIAIGMRHIISDFNPDYHKDICEGSSCLSDWLNASGIEKSSAFGQKKTYEGALDPRIPALRWKTISESTSTLVVLYDGAASCQDAALYDVDGNLIETTYQCGDEGVHGYAHYARFKKKGGDYDEDDIGYIQIGDSKCAISDPGWSSGRDKSRGCYTFDMSVYETELSENYCCGDDSDDVGKIQVIESIPYACIMNPDGKFEWVSPNGTHSKVPNTGVRGNIYDIFSKDSYEIKTEYNETSEIYHRVEPDTYNISYDLLSDGKSWFACQGDTIVPEQEGLTVLTSGNSTTVNISGEIHEYHCYNEQGAGRFVECYGDNNFNSFDSSIRYIFGNMKWSSYSGSHANTFARVGSFETIPTWYESWDLSSTSLKKTENKRSIKLDNSTKIATSNTLPITDWSSYDYLEGMIWYDVSPALKLNLNSSNVSSYYLDDYLLNDPKVNDWNVFRVPISDLQNVNQITFEVNDSIYLFKGNYVFYIDNLNLVSNKSKFCNKNTNKNYTWVFDRDDSSQACDAFNFEYANTMCCGDDGKEFFSDVTKGCWNSYLIDDGTRFQVVEVEVNGEYMNFICRENEACVHSIPRLSTTPTNLAVINLRNDSSTVHFSKSQNMTSNYTDDRLVFNVLKWEYLANVGDFRYCGENPVDISQTYEGSNINSNFNYNIIDYSTESMCTLTENYYCQISKGWTDDMYNIEPRDIPNAPFPEADCELNDPDPRCEPLNLSERIYVKPMPEINTILNFSFDDYGCCPSDYCWNGVACIEDQSNEAFDNPYQEFTINGEDGYRCIAGEWEFSYRKYSANGMNSGYCAYDDQCFVYKYGTYVENGSLGNYTPQCIAKDTYFGDYYCETGDWTSRTKYVANILSEKGGNTFSLFCDSYDNVLNYVGYVNENVLKEYINPMSESCQQIFGGVNVNDCVNNFCVLNSNGKISFGTSLNQEITAENLSFAELFDNFGLTDSQLQNKLSRADSGKLNEISKKNGFYWYYEPSLNAIFFSERKLTNNILQDIGKAVINTFESLISWLTGSEPESDALIDLDDFESIADLSFIKNNQMYSDIYVAEGRQSKINAVHNNQYDVYKNKYVDYVAVDYTGVSRNFCDYITTFDKITTPDEKDITCVKSGRGYKVFAKGSLQVWEDLTSKLRVLE